MWWTPEGERVLQGAEASLFKEALGVLTDYVRDDSDGTLWQFGIEPFDKLRQGQKLTLMAQAGAALLHSSTPAPKLTAGLEATVAAVYELVRELVEMEIGEPELEDGPPGWRELVLEACEERQIDDLPVVASDDPDEWDVLVACLAGCILWDDDWRLSAAPVDAEADVSRATRKSLGTADDYYAASNPDAGDEEAAAALDTLAELTRVD